MTEPMRENERIAKRIIDTSADGDNSPRYNWAEAELIKALNAKDSLIQAKESEIKALRGDVDIVVIENLSLRTLVKELGCGIKTAIRITMRTSGGAFAERLDETYSVLDKALLLIPEELRKDKI